MKGLLLKDCYMIRKYYGSILFFIAACLLLSFFSEDNNLFFIFYPVILAGMAPINLISYDEKEGWMRYSGALPYSRAQLVSVKYLVGLFFEGVIFAFTLILQLIRNMVFPGTSIKILFYELLLIFLLGMILSSCVLPFVFKFGSEKGRITYIILICVIGGVCASLLQTQVPNIGSHLVKNHASLLLIFGLLSCGIYLFSWYLSIVFFRKREF